MKRPVQWLEGELGQIGDLLDRGSLYTLSDEERQVLREETKSLGRKLSSIEDGFLTVGLLGGTGVGKSTLMNALAGAKIAATSHRRPQTDRILIYRHLQAPPLPPLTLKDVPYREITHGGDAVKRILLCDLPDFDSLMGVHRRHVLNFLENLDLLVWVTSPEKYADGRFYEFLRAVPKAKQNFYFVLNKGDLLFQEAGPEAGYDRMARLIARFRDHIGKDVPEEPLLYFLSAEQVLNAHQAAPWNQFPAFRQQVFQQRDMKQIAAIKADNLDVEIQRLLGAFQKEVLLLESFQEILESSVKELEALRAEWTQTGREALDLWLTKHVARDLLLSQDASTALVGPGYGLAPLFQTWDKRARGEGAISSLRARFAPPDEIAVSFRKRLERLEDSLSRRILRENLPSSFRQRLHGTLGIEKTFNDLKERFSMLVSLRANEPYLPTFRGFKTRQRLTYLLLAGFLLLAVGGEPSWRELLENPGVGSLLGLILSGVHTLFSSKGLAALLSYALLNLFMAFRFYRRYKTILRRETDKTIHSLKIELEHVWNEKLDVILEELKDLGKDIQSHISTISRLAERNEAASFAGIKANLRPGTQTKRASRLREMPPENP